MRACLIFLAVVVAVCLAEEVENYPSKLGGSIILKGKSNVVLRKDKTGNKMGYFKCEKPETPAHCGTWVSTTDGVVTLKNKVTFEADKVTVSNLGGEDNQAEFSLPTGAKTYKVLFPLKG